MGMYGSPRRFPIGFDGSSKGLLQIYDLSPAYHCSGNIVGSRARFDESDQPFGPILQRGDIYAIFVEGRNPAH